MQEIVQTRNSDDYGLNRCSVFGLNILDANGIEVPTTDDPRVIFLRTLSAQNICSAHTGNLYDFANDPQQFFGAPSGENTYTTAHVGVYGGTFYDAENWPTFPACFFSEVKDRFWQVKSSASDADIRKIISRDALALYVGASSDASDKMKALLTQPFLDQEKWLQSVTNFYELVILTGGDGWYFYVYARNTSSFDLLAPAISEAVTAVEMTDWYRENTTTLRWDEQYGLCFRLPELIPKPIS